MDIEIDFQLDDKPESMLAFLNRLQPVFRENWSEVRIDLRGCGYLGPDASAILFAIYRRSEQAGKSIQVQLPDHPKKAKAFCAFSGLSHVFEGGSLPDTSHPDCVTVPLREHHAARHDDVDPVLRLIRAFVQLDEDRAIGLGIAFSEVLQNVDDHAKSSIGAVSCARFLRKPGEVRIAIVDLGQGIATTLRRARPDIMDNKDALARVMEGGVSARSRINNAGQGLSNLKLCVTGPGGNLFIVTDDVQTQVGPEAIPRILRLPFRFPGTAIFFTLPTS